MITYNPLTDSSRSIATQIGIRFVQGGDRVKIPILSLATGLQIGECHWARTFEWMQNQGLAQPV